MTGNEDGETPAGRPNADDDANPNRDATPLSVLPSNTTALRTTHSALQNRLLNQQRSNILLQVLFHHMLNSRRRRQEEEAMALSPPPLPDRQMPVLSHEDALAACAMCRFCFEGSTEQQQQVPNSLVAPCNCDGGSRWVHLECLRQWQRLQVRTVGDEGTTYTAAGYICNVCNSPYLSRPPKVQSLRRNLLKRGTLLISKPNVVRTFEHTVILLLSDLCGNPQHGAFGLIVNCPLRGDLTPNNLLRAAGESSSDHPDGDSNSSTNNHPVIEWRRGGPVCGGRLGVVHYTVLHSYPPAAAGHPLDDVFDVDIDEEYFDEDDLHRQADEDDNHDLEAPLTDNEANEDGSNNEDSDEELEEQDDDRGCPESDTCAPLSLPVFDVPRNSPPLQFVASPHSPLPSTFSEESLVQAVQCLVRSGGASTNGQEETNDGSNATNPPNKIIVFSGYCKWRIGQLEREIQREVWDVCIDATPEDVLRDHGSGFWEELSESNRVLSWQRLMEEGDGGADDV